MPTHAIADVISRGMCIGCGACELRTNGAVRVRLGPLGLYEADAARATPPELAAASTVCPFSDAAEDEDGIAARHFPALERREGLGRHRSLYAGRVTEQERVVGSSSGGLTSWFLEQVLESGLVDGVIHVGRGGGDAHFEYVVSRSAAEVRASRKSVYYPSTLVDVINAVRDDGNRYAVVGVPCFIKALRLLARDDAALSEQLVLFVGLVCGHLKSRFFAESLAWQAGVPPEDLEAIDFRVKDSRKRSWDYDYGVWRRGDSRERVRPVSSSIDGNWGYGAFQPEACNFCDDVFAETADVVFGDAWLPAYTGDWRGTNVVLTRNARADQILLEGRRAGLIELHDLSEDDALRSQAGNFRHRRTGLRVRLADDAQLGLSVPRKRVIPGYEGVPPARIALIRQRRMMSRLSLEAFASAKSMRRLSVYTTPMRAAIRRYRRLERADWSVYERVRETILAAVKRVRW
jgi:coenzyme F420 hydrogenase subunit beta